MPSQQEQWPKPAMKLSESAMTVLYSAVEESRRLNHSYVGTEHLLLGLTREPKSKKALTNYGIDVEKLRLATQFIIGKGERPSAESFGLSERSVKVGELASEEARASGRQEIISDDILIAVVREGNGVGAGILETLGLNKRNLPELRDILKSRKGNA